MTNTTHIICLTRGNDDFTYGGLHEVVATDQSDEYSPIRATSNTGHDYWVGPRSAFGVIDYHPVTNSNILNAYAECVQAGKLAWEDVPAEYRGDGAGGDRGMVTKFSVKGLPERKLVAVTCPDVDGLPSCLKAGKRYEVQWYLDPQTKEFGCFFLLVAEDGIKVFDHTIKGSHLNGADWIPHYEGDELLAQEISATEAIKRLLDGEVLEAAPMNHTEFDRHDLASVEEWELHWVIAAKWRIPTPETFDKEEAHDKLFRGETLHPVGWDNSESVCWDEPNLCLRNTLTDERLGMDSFPDDTLFMEVK